MFFAAFRIRQQLINELIPEFLPEISSGMGRPIFLEIPLDVFRFYSRICAWSFSWIFLGIFPISSWNFFSSSYKIFLQQFFHWFLKENLWKGYQEFLQVFSLKCHQKFFKCFFFLVFPPRQTLPNDNRNPFMNSPKINPNILSDFFSCFRLAISAVFKELLHGIISHFFPQISAGFSLEI